MQREESALKALAPTASYCAISDNFETIAKGTAFSVDANRPYSPTPADVAALSPASGLACFSLNPASTTIPQPTDAQIAAITTAYDYFTERGYTCSCLLIDCETGRGIGLNYETRVYGASTFKGILAAYVCESYVDERGNMLSSGAKNLVESMIVNSDNNAYRSIHASYSSGIADWVNAMGINPAYVCRYRFPTYSAQESAALWTHVNEYLESGTESGQWLASLLANTSVSHLRAAVELGVSNGSIVCDSATVMNKAGWISGSANSTSDAGIIDIDGHRYVMSIMTSAPDCETSREAVVELAYALLATRENAQVQATATFR